MGKILKFKVSSAIKDIVGRDLITDDFIAVFELVKNSFDAHAKKVIIKVEENKLTIADNGKGMSLEELETKWLFLAFSAKKDQTEDIDNDNEEKDAYRNKIRSKRHYAGSKGIGRFSADRLGKKLRLITKSKKSGGIEVISIDWDDFKDQNKEFGTVDIEHETIADSAIKFPDDSKHGLILEIEGTKRWTRAKIIELKHSLEKLINPFSETNDFLIEIECKRELREDKEGAYKRGKDKGKKYRERDKVNGSVNNAILDILDLKTTQINVEIGRQVRTKIFDRGTLIYHIIESNNDYDLLEDVNIDLYFLNTAAKYNFTMKMGVQPINFGSVFLFKNGFRVQPFGRPGDDSWGLDYRAQQGHSRFLGTRDLFGRVEITTENTEEFKEVSSRDGGLVETYGYHQLMSAFKDKVLVRLERYVVGVLWGEAFKRKNYFGKSDDATDKAELYRKQLQENDKNSDSISHAVSNLGSKIDFIQLIKSLSSNKEIQIVEFNRDFVDLVNEKLDEIDSKYLLDLEAIAEKTNDEVLRSTFFEADRRYKQLVEEKRLAEERAIAEEERRRAAEERAKKEEEARLAAEKKQKEEEEKRIRAELEAERKEKERLAAELAKLAAEQKAVEEAAKRELEEKARKKAESESKREKDKSLYLLATRKTLSEDAEDLIHSIKVSSIGINESLEKILRRLNKTNVEDKTLFDELSNIKFIADKVMKLSMLVTKSNFKSDEELRKVNVAKFISEYIETYSYAYQEKVQIRVAGVSGFESRISVLSLSIVIDNLISNSYKAGATEILIEIINHGDALEVLFHDNGNGLAKEFANFPNSIFELGVKSDVEGSGIGLYSVKNKMSEMYGDISFLGNNVKLKGATFKLEFS